MKKPKVIEEYFANVEENKQNTHTELFNPERDNIDLQTQVTDKELRLIATLQTNDDKLTEIGVGNIYKNYIEHFLRLKISLDRQSRKEYVEVNKEKVKDDFKSLVQGMGVKP